MMKSALRLASALMAVLFIGGCSSGDPTGPRGQGGAAGTGGAGGSATGSGAGGHGDGDQGGAGGMDLPPPAPLEICINEFMPDNQASIADESGTYSDWIELHNPSDAPIELAGWSLTDDAKDPKKSALGAGLSLPPKDFVVLWADDTPASGPTHLGFKLDKKGGVVGLFAPDGRGSLVNYGAIDADFSVARNPDCCSTPGCFTFVFRGTPGKTNVYVPPVTVTLLPAGSVLHYIDTNIPPGPDFATAAYDDSALPSGPAPLGYGDAHIITNVSFGPDPNNKYITTWFRASFDVQDAASILSATLKLLRDDGALVSLNGVEIARSNLPAGAIDASALAPVAVGPPEETAYFGFGIDPSLFVEGANIITVEVHQAAPTSSDLGVDIEITAERPGPTP